MNFGNEILSLYAYDLSITQYVVMAAVAHARVNLTLQHAIHILLKEYEYEKQK